LLAIQNSNLSIIILRGAYLSVWMFKQKVYGAKERSLKCREANSIIHESISYSMTTSGLKISIKVQWLTE